MKYFEDLYIETCHKVGPYYQAVCGGAPETHSLQFVWGGSLRYQRNDESHHVLDRPAMFWLDPRYHYRYGPAEADGWWEHAYLILSGPRAAHLIHEALGPMAPDGFIFLTDPLEVKHALDRVHELFQRIESSAQPQRVAAVEWLVATALKPAASAEIESGIDDLATEIREDPLRNYHMQTEAKALGISLSQLRRRFRQRMGMSPYDYLLRQRMRFAARLLVEQRLPVHEVARRLGYRDQSQFSRLFKLKVGIAPAHYANRWA